LGVLRVRGWASGEKSWGSSKGKNWRGVPPRPALVFATDVLCLYSWVGARMDMWRRIGWAL
jgi:hypothetical protein